jgi:nicotinic acid mononucleotide adenylyltransferase
MDWQEFVASVAASRPALFRRAFVYAGSFDPIGPHHVGIIEELVRYKEWLLAEDPTVPVRVIVWPVGPYDGKTQLAPPKVRKEMLTAALAHLGNRIEIETIDLDTERAIGTTTYRMQEMLSHVPHTEMRDIYFTPLAVPSVVTEVWHVIGVDNVDQIKKWEQGEELLRHNARFIALARTGYEPKTKLPKGAVVLDFGVSGASTDIRTAIKSGEPWEHLLHPHVAAIVKREKLYGYNEKRSIAA